MADGVSNGDSTTATPTATAAATTATTNYFQRNFATLTSAQIYRSDA